jgi:FlaG/FlaF family flagellin (archaellin)
MKEDRKQHDEAVSSVIGEMIMIALVVILVALFATSAFSLIPGGREPSVDVAMKNANGTSVVENDTVVIFWHKGGDWVEKKDLAVVVIRKEDGIREEYSHRDFDLRDHADDGTAAFDLGGYLNVTLNPELKRGDIVRLITPKNVIYSGEVP